VIAVERPESGPLTTELYSARLGGRDVYEFMVLAKLKPVHGAESVAREVSLVVVDHSGSS
jgi:hypothetical protein